MDHIQINELTNHLYKFSMDYFNARKEYGQAKYELDIITASKLPVLRKIRANIGYEMALIELVSLSKNTSDVSLSTVENLYKLFVTKESEFKGLEKVIEAIQEKINVQKIIIKSDGSIQ